MSSQRVMRKWGRANAGVSSGWALVTIVLLVSLCSGHETGEEHHHSEFEEQWWNHLVEREPLPETFNDSYEEIDRWTVSGNLANYALLQRIKGLTLPVIVNLHFIGFNNFGNELMDLSGEQFEPWFGHVDHKVPHLVAPVGEEQTTVSKAPTRESVINYGFHLNLIKTAPLFDTILQDTILWNMRPEDREKVEESEEYDYFDDDDEGMEDEMFWKSESLSDLLFYGHLNEEDIKEPKKYYVDANHVSSLLQASATSLGVESAYNLYLLNPNTPVAPDEIYGYRKGFSQPEIDELRKKAHHPSAGQHFASMLEDVDVVPCEASPLPPIPLQLLPRSGEQLLQVLDYTKASAEWATWYIREVMQARESADSSSRQSQHEASSEDAASLIFSFASGEMDTVEELATAIMHSGSAFEQDYLARVLTSTGEEVEEDCLVDSWVTTGRSAFLDFTAGPFKWGPLVAGEGVRTFDSVMRVPKYDSHRHRQEQEEREGVREAEIVVLQSLLDDARTKYTQLDCENEPTADCVMLDMQIGEKEAILAELKGEEEVGIESLKGTAHEGEGMDAVMDTFLSRTSALVSKTLRHLVVPAAPLKPVDYAPQVVFQLYLLTAQSSYDPRAPDAFEYDEFKHQMLQFALPSQKFSFTFTQMKLEDLPGVAAAFQAAKRTAAIPSLSPRGEYYTQTQHYVDSMVLRDRLSTENAFQDSKTRRESSANHIKHVPVFFFSLNERNPILIDRYYQAKALDDAIIVVQNVETAFPSRLACNGNVIHVNYRNPLKPMLASAALFLGGVIPTHISYDPAHESATQDWLWSVGDNPLSRTSHGTTFNRFQIDIAQRNMVVTSLEKSISLINEGIDILESIHIGPNNKLVEGLLPVEMVQWFYSSTNAAWTETASAVAVLHFDLAVAHMLTAEDYAYQFRLLCKELAITMDAFQCLPYAIQETDSDSQMLLIIPALFFLFDIVLVVLVLLCRSKGPTKQKIN